MVQTQKRRWIRVTMLVGTLMFGLPTAMAFASDESQTLETTQTESASSSTNQAEPDLNEVDPKEVAPSETGSNETTATKYREFESTIEMEDSFLFLNGVYIPPPVELKFSNAGIEVNGQVFDEYTFNLSRYEDDRRGSRFSYGFRGRGERSDWGGRGDRDSRGEWGSRGGWGERGNWDDRGREGYREYLPRSPLQSLASDFNQTGSGTVAVFYSGEAPMLLETNEVGYELLKALLGRETPSEAELMSEVSQKIDFELWHRLVQGFKISPEFATRASEKVQQLEEVHETNERKAAAFILSQQIAFPLSMIAMVTVVIAFGHLMANPQQMVAIGDDPLTLANAKKATIWSLTIVGVLSALDLVWTLIAHQSGAMRELNPLGNGLIHDPVQLILFKITITGLAIGILYYLHEQPLARRATWWCCLVLTLLTARWLTFNSMFL
ncbi:hypothetical protein Rcae01_00655 [Novipirellula caenicola]|uniref:DUF5658 domain-containing protein n=2 Tax=Novipirellula caenicola TaxID=1536901 RepID=A0ABP9VJ37_9BACT